MEIKELQRDKRKQKKVSISLRVSEEISAWLRKNNVSPTKLFLKAVEEIRKEK